MTRVPVSRRAWAATLVALALAGCAVGPDFVHPAPPGDAGFLPGGSAADVAAAARGLDKPCACDADGLPADWWTLLGSPQLDALVQRALHASPTLAAARATLAHTEELRQAGAGLFLPQAGAAASAGRQESTAIQGGRPHAVGPYGLSTLTGTVSYSVDVFGARRRAVEGLGAQVDQARAELEGARIALAANVADAVVARAGYQAQAATLTDLERLQDDQLRIAQAQFDAGVASYLPVLALRSSRATTSASIAALRDRSAQAQTLLAVLCGEAPAGFAPPDIPLWALRLPAAPPLELPASWAAHRPDIVSAEAQLHAASAQIGVATAALLPDLALNAQGGRAAGAFGSLLSSGTPFWSLQALVAATLFDGGANLHARRAAMAAYDAAAAQYRQTVLAALAQVVDSLHALADDRDAWEARAIAADSAQDAVALAQARWDAGAAGYLDVLTSDSQLRAARVDLAGVTAQRLQDAVALYVALGGGWWNRPWPAATSSGQAGLPLD
ncbi:MAG TPA: efflux transporter outer membrane subunit [Burkholderiaceae bacterium]|nr:efflux transporter outer membrane subunit [Burkholderiaceae bacterium]